MESAVSGEEDDFVNEKTSLAEITIKLEEADTVMEESSFAETMVSAEEADTVSLAETTVGVEEADTASLAEATVSVEEEADTGKEKTLMAETPVSVEGADTGKEKTSLAEKIISVEEDDNVKKKTPLVETAVSMEEEENTVKEKTPLEETGADKTSLVDGSSSNNSVGEGFESSNPTKDAQIYPSEVDAKPVNNPQQDTTIAVQDVTISEVWVDLAQCFKTDKVFDSREAVIQWCQEVGRKNNTVLVITKSNSKPAGKGSIVELGCERGGVYKNHKRKDYKPKTGLKRKRAPNTKKCGCPFSLRSLCMAGNKWNIKVRCGRHNHEVENALTEHALIKRLKEDEEQLLARLTTSGLRPQQVLKVLKERNKENHSTIRTIYNARAKLRMLEMEGKSVMQQILKLSTQFHYMEWHRKDEETDELKDIVWSHPESTLLAKCFPSVLLVDYMCKTNRFKMPFFNVLGVTSTGISFVVAYVFMEEETEEHLSWVLMQLKSLFLPDNLPSIFVTFGDPLLVNAIGAVFPGASRLVCTSHIEQNIVINCKNAFEDDNTWNEFYRDWEHVWKAKSEEDYVDTYAQFVKTWKTRAPACVTDLCDTWLEHKESFCLAWTQNIKHFGNTVINRVETEHSPLKKSMESSAGSFFTCWEAMHNLINNQIAQIKSSFEKSLTSVRHEHQIPAFQVLRNHVSQYGLDLILLEFTRSEDSGTDAAACKCSFRSTHGLPCAHELVKYTQEGRPIPLSQIDQHWKQLSVVPVLENSVGFDCLTEVDLLRQRWIAASEPDRHLLVEKMNEIANAALS
ncbi:hypothetical protein C5167_008904 [Papaver somniferum]|uniref:MULE transposase domain-containing protein n=1 Tax=Papaver somniferum TaxID=3469 RepID=A0A4Y7JVU4_PAPSO|nr:PKS-NRPS hybrid synthetase CHGG_01239-like isoform X2 [Papaver somniferum]RZC65214.1 hypothetical protein C5167_008904 [Papaver somniferum]